MKVNLLFSTYQTIKQNFKGGAMLEKKVSDLAFGKLKKVYGRSVSYVWTVGQYDIKIETTKFLMNQRKFRELYLEASGVLVLSVSNEAWSMILNQAFSTCEQPTEEELEELWIRAVATYFVEMRTDEQSEIAEGYVYETTTGFIFTTEALVSYIKEYFTELDCCTAEWHHAKLLKLLNSKAVSVTLKNFKGRAIKLNNFSCRVDKRFYESYTSLREEANAA